MSEILLLNPAHFREDYRLIRDMAAPILAFAARDGFVERLSQIGNQFLAPFAHRLGLDAAVDRFSGHAIGMALGMSARHGQRDLLR